MTSQCNGTHERTWLSQCVMNYKWSSEKPASIVWSSSLWFRLLPRGAPLIHPSGE
jgi:hypothetical protein